MKITDDMLTGWFPPQVKPVRVGVYEAFMEVFTDRFGTSHLEFGFSRWDGRRWGAMHTDIKSANELLPWHAAAQAKSWRGLKEPQRD
jgi:hypothetical protein